MQLLLLWPSALRVGHKSGPRPSLRHYSLLVSICFSSSRADWGCCICFFVIADHSCHGLTPAGRCMAIQYWELSLGHIPGLHTRISMCLQAIQFHCFPQANRPHVRKEIGSVPQYDKVCWFFKLINFLGWGMMQSQQENLRNSLFSICI